MDQTKENGKFQAKAREKKQPHNIWKRKISRSTDLLAQEEGAEESRVTRHLKAKFHGARKSLPKTLAFEQSRVT